MMDDAAMADTKKLAIVTGASQGLSEGIVQGFRARGHGVVATLRSIDPHLVTIAGAAAIRAGKRAVAALAAGSTAQACRRSGPGRLISPLADRRLRR